VSVSHDETVTNDRYRGGLLSRGGQVQTLAGLFRLLLGTVVMALGVIVWTGITLVLLPSRVARIKACNYFGKTVCRSMVWLSGCAVTVRGREHLNASRPAIYAANHTSILDAFLGATIAPVGTVGIAKKEVVWYPFFGQLYLLSGHLRIDRGRTTRAKASLAKLGALVRSRGLSIFIWPEGTRSQDGRLLPLKKGLAHMAIQTGLPVVPIVVTGGHRAWEKRSLRLIPVPIEIDVLPPIDTSNWDIDHLDEHLEEVARRFRDALPADQRPQVKAEAA
jgi:1-acyl-sn-glycerol-3-phosphate acyltransferase